MATESIDTTRLLLPIHAEDHVYGPESADFTLVEYGDYECPDCGRLFQIIRDLQATLGDRLRIVYFDQNRPLNPDLTLRQALCPDGDSVVYQERTIHVASWAARFLFSANGWRHKSGDRCAWDLHQRQTPALLRRPPLPCRLDGRRFCSAHPPTAKPLALQPPSISMAVAYDANMAICGSR